MQDGTFFAKKKTPLTILAQVMRHFTWGSDHQKNGPLAALEPGNPAAGRRWSFGATNRLEPQTP